MNTTNKTIPEDDLTDYIVNNFIEGAILEISYNRVFIPGKIINIHNEERLTLTLQLKGELLNQTVDIDMDEIKNELVELRHTYGDEQIIVTIID